MHQPSPYLPSRHALASLLLFLLLSLTITLTPCSARTSAPQLQFNQMSTVLAQFNVTTKDSGTIDLEMHGSMQFFPSIFAGIALPLSNRPDFTIDMNVMLPHKDDDIHACSSPLRTMNEFNQTYADSWILIEQSSCGEQRYILAAMSGARGVIVAGCSPDAPYNCDPTLQQLMIITPIPGATVISVTSADGKRMMDYLNAKKAQANGAPIPKDTLVMTIKSAGPLVTSERQALIKIMTNTSMGSFLMNPSYDILPYWKKSMFEDPNWDPCLNRTKGIWCEGNNIVIVSMLYHFWNLNTGVIPPEIADLTELRYFSTLSNLWFGPVPQRYCELKKLKVLWLASQLAPPGITSLPDCDWPAMEQLWLDGNSLTSLPPSMSRWTNLARLHSQRNLLTSLPSLANLSSLIHFDVSNNAITGQIPTLSKAAPLKVFALGTNQLSGQIASDAFDGLSQLEVLDLNTNRFTGTLPKMVGCTNLKILDLSSQRNLSLTTGGFTDDWPDSYYALQKLQELYLQENSLTNSKVLTTSTMVSLTTIDLSHNNYKLIPPSNTTLGLVSDLVGVMLAPSLITLRLNHNLLNGAFGQIDTTYMQNIRRLYLSNNKITTLWTDIFSSGVIYLDLSNNEMVSTDEFRTTIYPGRDFEYLNLQGNPMLTYNDIPSWTNAVTTKTQLANQSYACQSLSVNTAVEMTFLVDPTFYKYKYCECQAGTFGKAPLCNVVPNNADLNPFSVISSKEIGSAFPTLIQSAGGIGSNLTQTSSTNVTSYAQAFSDSMYGQNRLVQGLFTSWTIDLSNLYSDDVDSLIAEDIAPPSTPAVYHPTSASAILSEWTPVRSITVRLHVSGTTFTQFDDVITIFSGGADLKGDRITSIRGTDVKPVVSNSSYTITPEYQQTYRTSISALSDPRLIEVQAFASVATVQFTSRQTSGEYFYATYSYDFVCPTGYFYDTITNPTAPKCRANYAIYSVSSSLRTAVFGVGAVGMFITSVCLLVLGLYWQHGVFRAASRSFMLLILVMMESMSLGAMLYAAVPESTSSGKAVCIGRAWLTCLPLASVLAIMLAKNRRLWAIFGATKLQVKVHSDFDLLATVLIISASQCVLLAVFSGLPLSKPVFELGHGSLSATLVKSCSQESGFMSWIGAEIAFVCALMLPTAYLGFKTRNLPSQYNESSHLQNALIVLMFFMVIIIPLDIFIEDDPGSAVLLQGLGQSFLTIVLTLIIFGPKIWYVFQNTDLRDGNGTQVSYDSKYSNGSALNANASHVGVSHVGNMSKRLSISGGEHTASVHPNKLSVGQGGHERQASNSVHQHQRGSSTDRRLVHLTLTSVPRPPSAASERTSSVSTVENQPSMQLTVTAPEETNHDSAELTHEIPTAVVQLADQSNLSAQVVPDYHAESLCETPPPPPPAAEVQLTDIQPQVQ